MVKIVKNILIMLDNLQQIQLKLLQKRVIQKKAEATGYLFGNKIANRITNASKNFQ